MNVVWKHPFIFFKINPYLWYKNIFKTSQIWLEDNRKVNILYDVFPLVLDDVTVTNCDMDVKYIDFLSYAWNALVGI